MNNKPDNQTRKAKQRNFLRETKQESGGYSPLPGGGSERRHLWAGGRETKTPVPRPSEAALSQLSPSLGPCPAPTRWGLSLAVWLCVNPSLSLWLSFLQGETRLCPSSYWHGGPTGPVLSLRGPLTLAQLDLGTGRAKMPKAGKQES